MKRILLAIGLLILLAVSASAVWVYRDLHTPVKHAKHGQYVEIARGSSAASVINKLADEGIIKHKLPLTIYLKFTANGSQLKAGEYDFPSPISPLGVFARLREGEQRLTRLTIVEGWTRWDIANAMYKIPELHLSDPTAALPLMNNVSLISDLDPRATNLEGYLFPETYDFPPDTKPAEVIAIMVKRFRTQWKPAWAARARSTSLS